MKEQEDIETVVENLYWDLNRIYSSEHSDNPEETQRAIGNLKNAVIAHKIAIPTIILKMKQMTQRLNEQNAWKTKLSIAIHSRFWEKTFVEMVPHRTFKME